MRFVAEDYNTFITMVKAGTPPDIDLVYSTDNGETWNDYIVGSGAILTNIGDEMLLKARTTNDSISTASTSYFRIDARRGMLSVSGNINSLIDGENFE